jgi:hypothetical protein
MSFQIFTAMNKVCNKKCLILQNLHQKSIFLFSYIFNTDETLVHSNNLQDMSKYLYTYASSLLDNSTYLNKSGSSAME